MKLPKPKIYFRVVNKIVNDIIIDVDCIDYQNQNVTFTYKSKKYKVKLTDVILLRNTGYTDDTETEIIEGSILQDKTYPSKLYVVKYVEDSGMFLGLHINKGIPNTNGNGIYLYKNMMKDFKVIGNVYQNPIEDIIKKTRSEEQVHFTLTSTDILRIEDVYSNLFGLRLD